VVLGHLTAGEKVSDNISLCLMKSVVNLRMFMKKLANWLAEQLSIMDEYEPKDIANGDETGLLGHPLPTNSVFEI
jgi:hypothetical protein